MVFICKRSISICQLGAGSAPRVVKELRRPLSGMLMNIQHHFSGKGKSRGVLRCDRSEPYLVCGGSQLFHGGDEGLAENSRRRHVVLTNRICMRTSAVSRTARFENGSRSASFPLRIFNMKTSLSASHQNRQMKMIRLQTSGRSVNVL